MKMNRKTIITIVLCILLIAATAGGLWWYDASTKKKTGAGAEPDGSTSGSGTPTSTPVPVFPLKVGSSGTEVEILQNKLNVWMAANWNGLLVKPKFQNGVRKGQEMKSLVVDGDFGNNTAEFCRFPFHTTTVTESQFNSMTASGWGGGGTSNGSGASSEWGDRSGFQQFGEWMESLFY